MEVQCLSVEAKLSKASITELGDEVWPVALTESNIMARLNSTEIYLINCSKHPENSLCV